MYNTMYNMPLINYSANIKYNFNKNNMASTLCDELYYKRKKHMRTYFIYLEISS